ncbi:hypothetical protein PVL29_003671 [Vitis rotundifolia]|uniref:PGG domain-containing protein n=1 Tax=Vitis rotundifolia TaxID=103349 RepID=A0AA39AFY9_VITRO|nr:hypothetical protein PVL29_003671 [Vitis rotundifolia]
MADYEDIKQERRIAKLCNALMDQRYWKVRRLCRKLREGPLQRISIYNDTVLHMMLPADGNHQFSDMKNNNGNTILHEVATSNTTISVAEELSNNADMLIAYNDLGVKPIFCAARYGQTLMFEFLANKMGLERQSLEDSKAHLQRNDGTTVLQISIALTLASMTTLQYLACNPTVFKRGKIQIRQGFIEQLNKSEIKKKRGFIKRGIIRDESINSLEELITLLVEKDTSWDASINSQIVGHSFEILSQKKGGQNSQESSTIKYKKSYEIFGNKFEVLARKLLSTTNNEGNFILHMVSLKRKSQASEKMQSPTLQLRDELLLFEKVKSTYKMLVSNPLNKENKNAEELFATRNEQLHQEAKEWLMHTTENCTMFSVFIATIALVAAYMVLGGSYESTGIPILYSKPFFVVFILADVFSLTLALIFVVAFRATIVLTMIHNPKNVVWSVVRFLLIPIFFLSYSPPLCSAILGHFEEWLKNFFVNLSIVLAIVIVIFLVVLFFSYM